MFFGSKKAREKKENEARLRRIDGFEVRYVTMINEDTYGENIIGKYGTIQVAEDVVSIVCSDKIIFSHPLEGLNGSELMSLDGIVLSYIDEKNGKKVEVVAYYKYHRK